ncbi:hypothetical protein GCM10007962_29700 [Yeosuana aromativorans]|uniref:Uncharacterized protein n=1 Tax=Yeosuana aromativorans TaxID=288019 RepID=A0A8J3FLB9_9FLAO|nr:hypothetical protein GCM10007962_29700 [Yeosuana aromativorans]
MENVEQLAFLGVPFYTIKRQALHYNLFLISKKGFSFQSLTQIPCNNTVNGTFFDYFYNKNNHESIIPGYFNATYIEFLRSHSRDL